MYRCQILSYFRNKPYINRKIISLTFRWCKHLNFKTKKWPLWLVLWSRVTYNMSTQKDRGNDNWIYKMPISQNCYMYKQRFFLFSPCDLIFPTLISNAIHLCPVYHLPVVSCSLLPLCSFTLACLLVLHVSELLMKNSLVGRIEMNLSNARWIKEISQVKLWHLDQTEKSVKKKKKSVKGGKRLNPPLTFSLVKQIMQGGKHMDTCDNDSFI